MHQHFAEKVVKRVETLINDEESYISKTLQ
jgi:hypothetical protein